MTAKAMNSASVRDANRIYFQALANSRASLGNLSVLPVLIMFLVGIVTFGLSLLSADEGREVLSFVRDVNVVIIAISALFMALSVFRKLLYKFQVFFSVALAGMALGLVYGVCLLTVPLVAFVNVPDKRVSTVLFAVTGSVGLGVVAAAVVVHALMLRHRLRVGHSEERTIGNFVAVSRSNRSKIVWITFGLVAVVPNVLTSGQYLANSLGALGLIFFACVTPSLPVEFAYLAYLKSKDRAYWEARPPRLPKDERRRLARKTAMWVFGIAVALALFWVFAKNFSAGV
ncbi:hypothetical protein [Leifsonia sp. AG29]|uniref:hypothetical protein n=1 Tax=Leifsonia sp. AG29 TaxID=2598860 RepID=UPI001E519B59|nr:hypothetical protein [Leifsonia sp. AG29]